MSTHMEVTFVGSRMLLRTQVMNEAALFALELVPTGYVGLCDICLDMYNHVYLGAL